jgi:hypothetical protein
VAACPIQIDHVRLPLGFRAREKPTVRKSLTVATRYPLPALRFVVPVRPNHHPPRTAPGYAFHLRAVIIDSTSRRVSKAETLRYLLSRPAWKNRGPKGRVRATLLLVAGCETQPIWITSPGLREGRAAKIAGT